jgi:solute carrier family 25 carnitine/acylcarnitine transporter 20/29
MSDRTHGRAGGIAGAVSWLSVYPFDVIKSRLQSQLPGDNHYRGWLDCGVKTIREEGSHVLWRGLSPTLARAFLVNAAIFSTYEVLMKMMHTHDPANAA